MSATATSATGGSAEIPKRVFSPKRSYFRLAALFLSLSAAIVVLVNIAYRKNVENLQRQVQEQLAVIADLKQSQIVEWREERIAHAVDIMNSFFLQTVIVPWAAGSRGEGGRYAIRDWLSDAHRFRHGSLVSLVDERGTPLLPPVGGSYTRDTFVLGAVRTACRSGHPVMADLHTINTEGDVRFHIAIPVRKEYERGPSHARHAAIVVEFDPGSFLYPLIRKWPIPGMASAETILLRREGNRIVFLNELRFGKNQGLSYSLPIDRMDILGVKAALGGRGIAEGVDYRGRKVFGALRPIPGTPWFMVAKVDREEVLGEVRRLHVLQVGCAVALIVIVALVLGSWQHAQRTRFYRDRYREEHEKTGLYASLAESRERFRALFESMTEGVALHEVVLDKEGRPADYRILEVNPAYARHTGIPAERARGALGTALYRTPTAPYLDEFGRVGMTGVPHTFETYFSPLKRHFSISIFSPGKGLFGTVFEDITDRKLAGEKIAAERERLLVTIRSIGDGVITTDIGGRIILMNRVAEELTGWSSEEAINRPLAEVFSIINELTRVRCDSPVDKVIATGGIVGLATIRSSWAVTAPNAPSPTAGRPSGTPKAGSSAWCWCSGTSPRS